MVPVLEPDANGAYTYTITAGDPAGAFAIDDSGNVTVADGTVLDFEPRMPNGMRSRSQNRVTMLSAPRAGSATLAYVLTGTMSWLVRASRTQSL